jgi:hypothetical protein
MGTLAGHVDSATRVRPACLIAIAKHMILEISM